MDLLRLILAYCLGERGLRSTAAWATAMGLADISNVALLQRLAAALMTAAALSLGLGGTTVVDEDTLTVGDTGITVTVGSDSYSGYPIGGQPLQITVNGGEPYNVVGDGIPSREPDRKGGQ